MGIPHSLGGQASHARKVEDIRMHQRLAERGIDAAASRIPADREARRHVDAVEGVAGLGHLADRGERVVPERGVVPVLAGEEPRGESAVPWGVADPVENRAPLCACGRLGVSGRDPNGVE